MYFSVAIPGLFLVVACAGGQQAASESPANPYRRLIEAEAMQLEGGNVQVQDNSYCSAGSAVAVDTGQGAGDHQFVQRLERTLAPGQYLVWVTLYLDVAAARKGDPLEVRATLGASTQVGSVARDGSASLNVRVIVDAAEPFDTLALAIETPVSRVLVDRVYLSAEVADFSIAAPQKDHFTIGVNHIRREVAGETSAPTTGNAIANGSFEAGLPSYAWSTPYQSSYTLSPEMISDDEPAHGQHFLRVPMYRHQARALGDGLDQPTSLTLLHRILFLKPETTYHFRGQFRANVPVGVQVWLDPAYPDRDQPGRSQPRGGGKVDANADAAWQPITATFTTPNNINGYMLRLTASAPGPATLDIDALTLTEAAVDGFEPAQPIEIGVTWQPPGRVFYADEPVEFDLAFWRDDAVESGHANMRVRVIDYFNRTVYDQTVERSASGPLSVELPTGAYRLLLDGEATAGGTTFQLPLQEYTFSVVHRPPAKMHGTLGSYITLAPQPIEVMSRAGVRSTTTLSASNDLLQNWRRMEPEPGQYVWVDTRVAHARAHDVKIIGNLDFSRSEPTIPDWAFDPDPSDVLVGGYPHGKRPFSRKAWEHFVEELTRHYADTIQDWLVLDEPFHTITPEEYTDLLKATYTAAKRGNPDCRVIAHGGYYPTWLPAVEEAGGVPYFDGISDYARSPEQAGRLRTFAQKHGKFVFTVEYEWNASHYRALPTVLTDWDRTAPWHQHPTQVSITRALSSMSWAHAIKFQRYDARYPGGDMTQLDLYKSLFELDGSLKPAGVAYAIAAGLLDGLRGAGELPLNDALRTLLFEDDERFIIVVATPADRLLQARFALPKDVTLHNLMGQRVDPGDVMLSHAALYVVGPRSELEAVKAMLGALTPTPALRLDVRTVVDEATGQHMLELTLTNLRTQPIAPIITLPPEVVRAFWRAARELPTIAPGERITLPIGLNVYAGDVPPTRDARLELYVDGHTAAIDVANVYEPGEVRSAH